MRARYLCLEGDTAALKTVSAGLSTVALVFWTLGVGGESDRRGTTGDGSPELELVEAIRSIEMGEFDAVLASLSQLVEDQPTFQLAQLVYADVLSARTQALRGFGHRAPSEAVDALLYEARARWRRYVAPPAPALSPNEILSVPADVGGLLLIDLEAYRLYVLRTDDNGNLSAVGDYYISIGKGGMDKRSEGDEKTPVGVYRVERHLPGETLPALYGRGAFPLDYPNSWDRHLGRTGSGIWIHGTAPDSFSRPPLSSLGCVTLSNEDLRVLEPWIDIGTTAVVVADRVEWVDPASVRSQREEFLTQLERWREDWESKDSDRYLGHYSTDFHSGGLDLAQFSRYKRRVNASKKFIRVTLSRVMIYNYPGEENLVLAQFSQFYESDNYSARAVKHQYWRREPGGWKIVLEATR